MAEGVLLTADAARRIAAATRKVEGVGVDVPPDEWYPYVPDEVDGLKLCKTTAAWAKDTSADLDEYTGKPGSEKAATPPVRVKAWNKFGEVATGTWVLVGQVGAEWYLLATEPKEVEVITGVSLGSSGLTFTKKKILVYGTKTPAPTDTVISTQACP
jgi:hypothetical protein